MNQNQNAFQPQIESPGEEQNDQMNNLEEEQDDLNQFLNNNEENNLEEYQDDEEYQNPADVGEEQNLDMNMGYMDNPADLGAEQNPAMEGQDQYMDDLGEEELMNEEEYHGEDLDQLNENENEQDLNENYDINELDVGGNELINGSDEHNLDENNVENVDINNVDLNNLNYPQDINDENNNVDSRGRKY